MDELKSNHQVKVIRVNSIRKHPNADKLEIIDIPGTSYQYVGSIGQFPVGSLAAYVQPDSVVPFRSEYDFLWEGKLSGEGESGIKAEYTAENTKKYRRIKAKKLRKEWSEGLLIPLTEDELRIVGEGDDVAGLFGITHYVPPEEPELGGDDEYGPGNKQNKIFPRSFKGWMYFLLRILTLGLYDPNGPTGGANEHAPEEFRPIFDVEAYKNFPGVFQPGESVVITEKIHGSNGRFTYVPDLLGSGHMYAGSRKLWKKKGSKNIWREALKQEPWIETWCRTHPNYTLYGEVVPTQKGFHYGCEPGDVRFFVFSIRNPEGNWIDFQDIRDEIQTWKLDNETLLKATDWYSGNYLRWVPVLYEGPFDEKRLFDLADGKSEVLGGTEHIREGVVVLPTIERQAGVHGLGRLILKVVSNKFLEKDSE